MEAVPFEVRFPLSRAEVVARLVASKVVTDGGTVKVVKLSSSP